MKTQETIRLHNIQGIARLSGEDANGNMWVQFDQLPGECAICGAKIESGWLCLDGGEEVCSDHIYTIVSH